MTGQQEALLRSARYQLVKETSELPEIAAEMNESDRARIIYEMLQIVDYVISVVYQINQHNWRG